LIALLGRFGEQEVDNRLSLAELMIMPKRDNRRTPLYDGWRSRFHGFLVEERLVPEDEAEYFVHPLDGNY